MNAPNSIFDPSIFLDAQVTEVNEKRPPLPVQNPSTPDGLYIALCGEPVAKSGEKDGKPWLRMNVPLKIEVPQELQAEMKLPPQVTITDGVFIDLTPDGQGIDNAPGKNRGQKAYREALDLNKSGDVFAWRMVTGRPVKIRLTHELYQEQIQERIAGVFKAA